MTLNDEKERLWRSWVANAPAWTEVVREGRIESRRAGTDAAIVARNPASVTAKTIASKMGE